MTEDLRDALKYAVKRTSYKVEQDDLEQEVHLKLMRRGYDLATIDRPLLFHLVWGVALDMLRKYDGRRSGTEREVIPVVYAEATEPSLGASLLRKLESTLPGPDEMAEATLMAEHLGQAIAALPERQRTAMTLHLEGLNGTQIAKQMKTQPQTARILLARARAALRTQVYS